VVVGLPVLRLRGVFLAIATIGFIEALRLGVILNLPITGEGLGLKVATPDPLGGINIVLIALVVMVFLMWRLTKGRLGQAWSAIRQDEVAALSQGINVARYKLLAFTLSAVIAGFAGALEAHLTFSLDPSDTQYGVSRAVQILTFAVLGGSGNIFGPVVGALFLTTLPEIIRQAADYRDVLSGVILIAVIVFRPQGIVSRGGLAIVRPRWWPRALTRAPSPG
jgi:branched-chain amino acid transport system permease protein